MVNAEKPETWQATCAHEHTHIHTHTQPTVSSCVCLYIYVWCKPAGLCCNRGRMDIPAKKLQQPCRLWCIKHAHTGKDRVVCLFCSSSLYSWWWYFFSFFFYRPFYSFFISFISGPSSSPSSRGLSLFHLFFIVRLRNTVKPLFCSGLGHDNWVKAKTCQTSICLWHIWNGPKTEKVSQL